MELAVLEEVDKFTEIVKKKIQEKKELDQKYLEVKSDLNIDLSIAVVNSLWSILTGEKITDGDKKVEKYYLTVYVSIDYQFSGYFFQVSDVLVGAGQFIRRESMMGALMIYPWLRHLPLINSNFTYSKSIGPMRMRQLQDDMVAIKQVRRRHTFQNLLYFTFHK